MTHKSRWLASAGAIAAAALLAACSSGSSSSSPASAGSSSPSGSASAGVTKAEAMVSQLEATTSTYPVPTASISGVSKLKGKTFYYIPLVQFIPGFVVTAATMKTALAAVGANLQVCNGQSQPSAISSCIGQATGAGAAGIILDSIPDGMAANAISAANAKGIPVIIADQIPPSGTTNSDLLAYVPGVVNQPTQIAWWTIANSGGKANLIIAEEADSPSSISYVQTSLAVYKQYCPGCTVTVKQITATMSSSEVASATSANILANPNADYYYTEFEDSLQPAIQGIQQSNKPGITLTVAGGSTDGLGLLAKGSSPVKAVVVVDQAYAGYALTDEILRMATKSAPVTETFPSRLFTAQNIGTISVTAADQSSGAWFGDSSFQSDFETLWGVG
jgi:ribose transport system substrate-binding protein